MIKFPHTISSAISLGLGISILMGSMAHAEVSFPSAVNIERALHFQTLQGEAFKIQPGMYEVQAKDNHLQLLPEETSSYSPVTIQAHEATHGEQLDTEHAFLMPSPDGNTDRQHLLFGNLMEVR